MIRVPALTPWKRWTAKRSNGKRSLWRRWVGRSATPLVVALLVAAGCVAAYALVVQDYYLCPQAIFLAFIPYTLWSAHRRTGTLDVFAPDVGFPVAYVAYLFLGSVELPFKTQFGLTLPAVIWWYYILGLVSYLLGARLLRPPSPAVAAFGKPKTFWPEGRFVTLTLVLLVIGMAARFVAIARFGLAIFHAEDETARVVGTGGVLGVLGLCMEAAFECIVLYLLVKKPHRVLRLVLIVALCLIVLNAVATTNRNALLRIFLCAVIIFHYTRKRVQMPAVFGLALFTIVFTSVLGTFRDVAEWGDAHVQSLEQAGFSSQDYWLFSGYNAVRLPTETFYMALQEVPELSGYSYGATSLASLAEILPGHRPGPSEIVKNRLRLQFVGFGAAATILAPLWFDGGALGIVIGMFLFGFVWQEIYRRVLVSSNYVWILVYGWFVQNAFKAIKDDILPELGFTFVITLFFLVSFLAGHAQRREEPAQWSQS
jgi:oligosaccharide repeat unit polymerase